MTSRHRASSRRTYLTRIGAVLASAGLGGCLDALEGSTDDDERTGSPTPTAERTTGDPGTAGGTTDDGTETPTNGATETDTDGTETPVHADYETTEVAVRTPDGEVLGSVTAAIADTRDLRYLGLSDTESLPEDRGMLFVYESVADRTFVMREMDFGIDIVYADDEGVITEIHHAPEPGPDEDGEEQRYPGRGQYVLEVNYEWTTDRGVTEGDVLQFDL